MMMMMMSEIDIDTGEISVFWLESDWIIAVNDGYQYYNILIYGGEWW